MTNLDELALASKDNRESFNALYEALYVERRRFMSDSVNRYADGIDAEAIFNDVLLNVINEYQAGKSFIGLLRIRLDSRRLDAVKSEMKRKHREWEYVDEYCDFSWNPLYVNRYSVHFRDYVSRMSDTRLIQAIILLDEGVNWYNASKRVGFTNQQTLKKHLRRAFDEYIRLNG